jgi:hypothetical protein
MLDILADIGVVRTGERIDTFCRGHPSEATADGIAKGMTHVRFVLHNGELAVAENVNGAIWMDVFSFTSQPCNATVMGLAKCCGRIDS